MSQECRRSFRIKNALGLHARAATKLVQLVGTYPYEVELSNGEHRANAKSVMGLLLPCSSQGASLSRSRRARGPKNAWTPWAR